MQVGCICVVSNQIGVIIRSLETFSKQGNEFMGLSIKVSQEPENKSFPDKTESPYFAGFAR